LEVYPNDYPWYSDPLSGAQAHNVENFLQDWNVRDFELLCRFPLYEDAGLPARVLQGHPESQLHVLLKYLSIHADNLDRDLMIRAILERLAPKQHSNTSWWSTPDFRQMDDMNAERIAHDLNGIWGGQFRQIPFSDIVRWAQGYTAASVTGFLNQVSACSDQLVEHLLDVPEASKKYTEVERVNIYCLASLKTF
jgi:hypothetical protein